MTLVEDAIPEIAEYIEEVFPKHSQCVEESEGQEINIDSIVKMFINEES